jgi:hypothetical protein
VGAAAAPGWADARPGSARAVASANNRLECFVYRAGGAASWARPAERRRSGAACTYCSVMRCDL